MYTDVLMVVGGLVLLYGLPLYAQLIPRNAVYGFRAAAMLQNDRVWYRVNRVFGGGFVLVGLVHLAVGALFSYLGSPTDPIFGLTTVLLLVIPLFVVYIRTMVFAHKAASREYRKKNRSEHEEQ